MELEECEKPVKLLCETPISITDFKQLMHQVYVVTNTQQKQQKTIRQHNFWVTSAIIVNTG